MLAYSQDYKESTEYWMNGNQRALTRLLSKTGLHPLDRHDEGMKGHQTR
jgi:hypothetical protein